jgi:hypothetical protein
LKLAKEDINRKKEMLLVLKNEKDEKENVIKELKGQIFRVNRPSFFSFFFLNCGILFIIF